MSAATLFPASGRTAGAGAAHGQSRRGAPTGEQRHGTAALERVKTHRVRTLPSMLLALNDLVREADNRGVKHIGLLDIHPARGASVSLVRGDDGRFYLAFEGVRL